jgi:hypothetical protein
MALWDDAIAMLPRVYGVLTAGRSCAIAVIDDTDNTLTQSAEELDHGGYAQGAVPLPTIAPHSIMTFGAQSGDGSIATGCEGWLTYTSDDGSTFTIHWDNPWFGSNGSDASTSDPITYSTNAENSVGNQNATYRFMLSPN